MQQTLSALGGAGAVVGSRRDLDRAAFDSLARGLSVQPGLSALALEQVVRGEDRAAFERRTGITIVDRLAGGGSTPAPSRAIYYPVVAVSPDTQRTRSLMGFDMRNDPVRAPVEREAVSSGEPRLSPPLALSATGDPGFLVLAPLYRRGQPVESPLERAAALTGFVSGAFRSEDVISLVTSQLPPGTSLGIMDGRASVGGTEMTGVSRHVAIGGRSWTISVSQPGEAPNLLGPIALTLAGVFLAGLVWIAIAVARRREARLEISSGQLRADARRNDVLRGLSEALLDNVDVLSVLAAIARCADEAFGPTRIMVALTTEDREALEVFDVGSTVPPAGRTLVITSGDVLGRVCRSGRSSLTEHRAVVSDATVPLAVDGRSAGALQLVLDPPRTFGLHDLELLEDIASSGARALEQARLFAAVDEAREEAERDRSRVESQRRLSLRLSRAGTAEEAADVVLRRVIGITGSVAGGVALGHEDGYLQFVAVWGMAGDDPARMPRLSIDDAAASSQTFRTGREAFAGTTAEFQRRYPATYATSGAKDRGVWALPLVVEGDPIGAVVLILDVRNLPSDDDRDAVRALAAQVAQALGRARRSDRTREAAEELQRAMLPSDLPTPPGAEVIGLYRSATQILEVGGDWYDAIEVDGSVMAAVGDVVGRGVSAAATMGQLRVAWRALAHEKRDPAPLLQSLDRFAREIPGAEVTTVVCAQLDVATGRLRYASAGHLPPLIVDRHGRARFLTSGRSGPLAVLDHGDRSQADATMGPGDTLLLFTDGLVERRDEPIDIGLDRLRREAERLGPGRASMADDLVEALVRTDEAMDDIAILTLTLGPSFRLSLPREPEELAPTRAALRAWLADREIDEALTEDAILATGEALANAIEHPMHDGPTRIDLVAWVGPDHLRIRVTDRGRWRDGRPGDGRGHGLAIMRNLMDRVSVADDGFGTRIEMSRSLGAPDRVTIA
jgi:serine phosphatase RsbU (regulator of sigma subunit)/CHASE1-domain containing sensor protein/anti-sigma regulatory factor (Ser/Thr protein kinase)